MYDLDLWNKLLYSGKLLQPASFELMKKRYATRQHPIYGEVEYGYGLLFKKGEEKYTSPDGNITYNWIYLGATHKVMSAGKRVICMTSNAAAGEFYIGFFEDGSSVFISKQQHDSIVQNAIR